MARGKTCWNLRNFKSIILSELSWHCAPRLLFWKRLTKVPMVDTASGGFNEFNHYSSLECSEMSSFSRTSSNEDGWYIWLFLLQWITSLPPYRRDKHEDKLNQYRTPGTFWCCRKLICWEVFGIYIRLRLSVSLGYLSKTPDSPVPWYLAAFDIIFNTQIQAL